MMRSVYVTRGRGPALVTTFIRYHEPTGITSWLPRSSRPEHVVCTLTLAPFLTRPALSLSTSRSRAVASLASSPAALDAMSGVSSLTEHVEHGVYGWRCSPVGTAMQAVGSKNMRSTYLLYMFTVATGDRSQTGPTVNRTLGNCWG